MTKPKKHPEDRAMREDPPPFGHLEEDQIRHILDEHGTISGTDAKRLFAALDAARADITAKESQTAQAIVAYLRSLAEYGLAELIERREWEPE